MSVCVSACRMWWPSVVANGIRMNGFNEICQNSSSTDNDLAFTSQDLNDLAIRIGADLGLPDINDIHVVDESVNHDILANVDQSQEHMNREGDIDMDTIVIETINEVDMSDAIVFGNVGNDVTISSSNPFDRQSIGSFV
ncbi:unnamed protein product [Oppiella nova]|uniref:Uncharacterized protein n=1 Tax=Oppiella nova TaxID=334625 RepID=A0A7R9MIJ9_9ACAR|nr:unnamed protein product [Oppiella nova]CAG2178032.1 unnamed protein product [Oppiella nova]